MVYKNKPFLNLGPGEHIKEELEERNWTQEDFSEIIGMSLKHTNELLNNKIPVNFNIAFKLSKVFGQSAQYWINLDINYRMRMMEETDREEEIQIKKYIFEHMPAKEMVKKEWLKKWENNQELFKEVKKFWNIDKIDFSFLDRKLSPSFRKSKAFEGYNKYYALTWFYLAKKLAKFYDSKIYDKDKLNKLLNKFNNYTILSDGANKFIENLYKSGVKFFVLSHFRKTYLDGASYLESKNPVIIYTIRHDRTDNFWFTLAHELGHILLHLKNEGDFFIDNLNIKNTKWEEEADTFAMELLKVDEILNYFKLYKKYISKKRIIDCSKRINISPSIVVGVLQYYGEISRRHMNKFKDKISDKISDKYFAEKFINTS